MKNNIGGTLMERIRHLLQTGEQRMLFWANRRSMNASVNTWLGRWLGTITHMGGATFTLVTALLLGLLAPSPWNTAGWQSLAAVAISHIPVFIVKRKFKRLRPYQKLEKVNIGRKPLVDPSFPSGHTTAVFAWMIPLLMAEASLMPLLLPLAFIIGTSVAWSRMYLGLHYPSDVAVGGLLGTATALGTSYIGWLP
ncbi:phosphatase PAP2 family protein [Paenibacillus tarimensis]|uniref:phosphatase PAP2 family protein n=1 Tax=Paenibacillus tarimensis TaxID=416012 RepID=UPI001F2A1243|nr:phosphatase PAP2 family protein [Paenibacillus tarimensis]MCF2942832.1 phosphatase PAP2 family protein [Paenibacillus tarimensis]